MSKQESSSFPIWQRVVIVLGFVIVPVIGLVWYAGSAAEDYQPSPEMKAIQDEENRRVLAATKEAVRQFAEWKAAAERAEAERTKRETGIEAALKKSMEAAAEAELQAATGERKKD